MARSHDITCPSSSGGSDYHRRWVLNSPNYIASPVAVATATNTGTHTDQEEECDQDPANRKHQLPRTTANYKVL